MKFNCNVNIVDAIMGSGKTFSIMNYINQSKDPDEHFLIITPFLDEVERYYEYCKEKNFKTPKFEKRNETKLDNLKELILQGRNIVSTHALFQKFDNELIDMCKTQNYTLIMDEVANVVDEYSITKQDFELLKSKYVDINPETKQLIWKEEYSNYVGKFNNEKRLCELGSLVCYGDSLMVWLFPIEVFNGFNNIYILTYMFNKQLQKYYYDYYGITYTYWTVSGNSLETYHLVPYDSKIKNVQYNYDKLIHICDIKKMNIIGDKDTALSKAWYSKNGFSLKLLKNNIYNYFFNICGIKSNNTIWTTFKEYKNKLKGNGYTKGFIPLNSRATNKYKDRNFIVYPVNRYLNPFVKNFFSSNNIYVDSDGYALSEMLQFIWRSAIRDGKEIWIYVPSKRMRKLLQTWIKQNSPISNGE